MSDERDAAADGGVGIGMTYGAGISSIATYTSAFATGSKATLLLAFVETGMVLVGMVKSMRADNRLRQMTARPTGQHGPAG